MRKIILFLVILSFPTILWAADPIIGTWKLNVDKSKESTIKELTEVYKEIDSDQIELTRIGLDKDDIKFDAKYIWPNQGGIVKMVKGKNTNINMLIVELLVAPNEWYAIWYSDGKQVQFIHKIISKDGKTMYQTLNRVDPQGNLTETEAVWERQ